jgi:hypothetical protein
MSVKVLEDGISYITTGENRQISGQGSLKKIPPPAPPKSQQVAVEKQVKNG